MCKSMSVQACWVRFDGLFTFDHLLQYRGMLATSVSEKIQEVVVVDEVTAVVEVGLQGAEAHQVAAVAGVHDAIVYRGVQALAAAMAGLHHGHLAKAWALSLPPLSLKKSVYELFRSLCSCLLCGSTIGCLIWMLEKCWGSGFAFLSCPVLRGSGGGFFIGMHSNRLVCCYRKSAIFCKPWHSFLVLLSLPWLTFLLFTTFLLWVLSWCLIVYHTICLGECSCWGYDGNWLGWIGYTCVEHWPHHSMDGSRTVWSILPTGCVRRRMLNQREGCRERKPMDVEDHPNV